MRIGKASAYGIFATLYVAQHQNDGPVHGRDIAQTCDIPVEYLLKILQQLVRSQILASVRGRTGGFRLRRQPQQTTLLDIIEAIEGPIDGCLIVRNELKTPRRATARLADLCEQLAEQSKILLRKTTIRQLMD